MQTPVDSKSTVVEEDSSIHSPFILGVQYYGPKGKISKKADMDLFEFLDGYAQGTLPNQYKGIKVDVKEIFAQIIVSILELHTRGLVHRDIKPENFLVILENGSIHIILADLDTIAFFNAPELISEGTEGFKSPEICETWSWWRSKDPYQKAEKKSVDCYAVGKTLLEVIGSLGNKDQALQYIAESLCKKTPSDRMSIEKAAEILGNDYIKALYKKFSRDTYIDSYIQYGYPDPKDAFLLLPVHLKKIYQIAADLVDAIGVFKHLQTTRDHIDQVEGSADEAALALGVISRKAKELLDIIKQSEAENLFLPIAITTPLKTGAETSFTECERLLDNHKGLIMLY